MNSWLIVPRDPLIFRDGKPFTATPGERAKSIGFPFPATIAGAVRTRSGTDPQTGAFDKDKIPDLLSRPVHGPVLVEVGHDQKLTRYFPAPADALLVETDEGKQFRRYALKPLRPSRGAVTDQSANDPALNLVGHSPHAKDKPYYKAPVFWNWETMQAWLEDAADAPSIDPVTLGLESLAREYRTHVSIDSTKQTALEGALFQTSGMEFTKAETNDEKRMKDAHLLAIALATTADLTEGIDFLGGERRMVNWRAVNTVFPECPQTIKDRIRKTKSCRLVLATPAHFKNGYLPEYLINDFKVVAAAVPRYQTISGWDYTKERGGAPKPTRRLAPAGSVYFLDLKEVDTDQFIEKCWLKTVSDDEQSRRDGFGLALLGTWDGVVSEMEVNP